MLTARQFFKEYCRAISQEDLGANWYNIYQNRPEFTKIETKKIGEIIENTGMQAQTEYFRIDITGWLAKADEIAYEASKYKLNPHLWDLGIAVEHENDSADWLDEIIKLMHVRCPLKVVIGYNDYVHRLDDDHLLSDSKKLSFVTDVMKKTWAFQEFIEACAAGREEYLVILGNSGLYNVYCSKANFF